MSHAHHVPDSRLLVQLQALKNELFTLRMAGDARAITDGLIQLARLQGVLEQHEPARASYQEALGLARQQKIVAAEAECLRGLGIVSAHLADVRGALLHLDEAAGVYKKAKDVAGEALCHAAAAEVVRASGDLPQAEAGLLAALELFRQVHDHGREARVLVDLGDVRMELERFSDAREAYLEALPIVREEVPVLLGTCLLGLAEAHGFSGQHAEARSAAIEAAALFTKLGDEANEARARWDAGMAHFFLGELTEATQAFARTRILFEKFGDADGLIRVKNALATVEKKRAAGQ